MPAGRHGHKMREYKRRIDALLEAERERRRPPPLPISEEHKALRERIERGWGAVLKQVPEGPDLDTALMEIPELEDLFLQILELGREEHRLLASQGVDPRPYDRYEPKF